jgi:GNAT superfamily N-acetyltransferase
MTLDVRDIRSEDEPRWRELFEGYRAFYRLPADAAAVARTWEWVSSGAHGLSGLVAVRDDRVVGIAHLRLYARPSAGRLGMFLDDLFTAPEARGSGVATALLRETAERAARADADVIRWTTATDNAAARGVYDRVGRLLPFVMYEMSPAPR